MGKKKVISRPLTPIPSWLKSQLKNAPIKDVVKSAANQSARALFTKAEKAASGAPFATLPRPRLPAIFETRAGKRKRISSPRYSPGAVRLSPELVSIDSAKVLPTKQEAVLIHRAPDGSILIPQEFTKVLIDFINTLQSEYEWANPR
ncbi:Oidioi.mRNA.OKI2018_I69.chr1.g432.t1.cds [Oikopleura dioica]|uniref:Oidioi.mRNA.OKI2018_I69.chr1.g432.t1.cds n=1 Tax=Oikopleura dioica TaxID=34765 RepID=A0ABN7SJU0_OIKDI|nr:Oidioi.mRNA.OKI2018_I69.chr1.g432.t1.cds [Oikopleura dioica]